MKAVADHVAPEGIRSLAAPSNIRLGREIAENGVVELVEFSPLAVVARVRPAGGQRRTVELRSTEAGLACKCTCSSRGLFCKHCVAAALAVREKPADGKRGASSPHS